MSVCMSIVLELESQEDETIPVSHGRSVHGMFLNVMGRRWPDLIQALHAEEEDGVNESSEPAVERPFTLSLLYGSGSRRGHDLVIAKGEKYYLRITSIEQRLSDCLADLTMSDYSEVRIDRAKFGVSGIHRFPDEHPDAIRISYEDMVNKYLMVEPSEALKLSDRVSMRFLAPTTFRDGKKNYPLPSPEKTFRMLVAKWEAYAPVSFREEEHETIKDLLLELAENILVSRFNLRSRMVNMGEYKLVGFVGECEFLFRTWRHMPAYKKLLLKQWFHVLCDFAFFAGVGYKTTMGMGQARKL